MRNTTAATLLAMAVGAGTFLWWKGRPQIRLGRSVAALQSDPLALPSNPTAGPDWDSAVALAGREDPRAAARGFQRGGTSHPADAAWPQAEAVCWARAQEHDSALLALDRCLSIAPLSPEATTLRRNSRLQLGFLLSTAGQSWRGRQLAEAVLQEFPTDSDAQLLLGYSHALDGSSPVADSILSDLVARHPGHSQARVLLVEIALRRGNAAIARSRLSELAARDPSALEVRALETQVKSLEERKPGTSNGHLRAICSEPCPVQTEADVLSTAEDAWNILRPGLGFDPPDPVAIQIGGGPQAPHWAAATFDGQVHLPVEVATDPVRRIPILRHELTHAFLAQASAGRIPLWFNEGLAQWYQGERITSLPGSGTAGWLDSLPSRRTFMDLDEDQAELAYHYSLAVTQELMEMHNSTALESYLRALREGREEREAFQSSFGDDYPHLSSRIRARL
jgi:hypothetical protein